MIEIPHFPTGSPGLMIALAWVLTYLVHSTLLLSGAWLASRWLRGRLEPIGEIVWKCALVGGLFTASVQSLGGLPSFGGHWQLAATPSAPALSDADPVGEEVLTAQLEPAPRDSAEPKRRSQVHPTLPATVKPGPAPDLAAGTGLQQAAQPKRAGGQRFGAWIMGQLLLAISGLGLLRLGWAQIRLGRGRRSPITSGPLFGRLRRLRQRTGVRQAVRLTRSTRFPVPMALGVLRKEICVPTRALSDLNGAQQDTMLAHELAHLLRRDPLWLALASALERVFWFQPLNRVARSHLQESAEFACDSWAAEQTHGHLPLASCLTEVAGWTVSSSATPEIACAVLMAGSPSTLGRRIARLLQPERALSTTTMTCCRWLAPLVLLAGATAVAPAISAGAPLRLHGLESDPAGSLPDGEFATHVPPLPGSGAALSAALTELEQEISSLAREVALLRLEFSEGPTVDSVSALLDQLIQQASELQCRAAELDAHGLALPFTR